MEKNNSEKKNFGFSTKFTIFIEWPSYTYLEADSSLSNSSADIFINAV